MSDDVPMGEGAPDSGNPGGKAAGRGGGAPAGHRSVSHTADCIVEAWGPDRASCLREALAGMVEEFAEIPDAAATRVLPLGADRSSAQDALVALLEDVIYAMDVLSVVPVAFHLEETEEGGVAGHMEAVPAGEARIVGPVPKAVSYHELSMDREGDSWRCHVLLDV
jgi:SHS2 domain-containing protein